MFLVRKCSLDSRNSNSGKPSTPFLPSPMATPALPPPVDLQFYANTDRSSFAKVLSLSELIDTDNDDTSFSPLSAGRVRESGTRVTGTGEGTPKTYRTTSENSNLLQVPKLNRTGTHSGTGLLRDERHVNNYETPKFPRARHESYPDSDDFLNSSEDLHSGNTDDSTPPPNNNSSPQALSDTTTTDSHDTFNRKSVKFVIRSDLIPPPDPEKLQNLLASVKLNYTTKETNNNPVSINSISTMKPNFNSGSIHTMRSADSTSSVTYDPDYSAVSDPSVAPRELRRRRSYTGPTTNLNPSQPAINYHQKKKSNNGPTNNITKTSSITAREKGALLHPYTARPQIGKLRIYNPSKGWGFVEGPTVVTAGGSSETIDIFLHSKHFFYKAEIPTVYVGHYYKAEIGPNGNTNRNGSNLKMPRSVSQSGLTSCGPDIWIQYDLDLSSTDRPQALYARRVPKPLASESESPPYRLPPRAQPENHYRDPYYRPQQHLRNYPVTVQDSGPELKKYPTCPCDRRFVTVMPDFTLAGPDYADNLNVFDGMYPKYPSPRHMDTPTLFRVHSEMAKRQDLMATEMNRRIDCLVATQSLPRVSSLVGLGGRKSTSSSGAIMNQNLQKGGGLGGQIMSIRPPPGLAD